MMDDFPVFNEFLSLRQGEAFSRIVGLTVISTDTLEGDFNIVI